MTIEERAAKLLGWRIDGNILRSVNASWCHSASPQEISAWRVVCDLLEEIERLKKEEK